MSFPLAVTVLGVPAMFAAGVASSAHCVVMCGWLHGRGTRLEMMSRHAGRLVAYALLGAVAGGAGQLLLQAQAAGEAGHALRGLLLVLLALGFLRATRTRGAASCCTRRDAGDRGARRAAVAGLLSGAMPCALLYAAAGYAALSASAAQGALLLLAFGLGTTPALGLSAWAWRQAGGSAAPVAARPWLALALLLSGLWVLSGMAVFDTPWCRVAT